MNLTGSLEQLRDEIRRFTLAPYLLTVDDDARPHAVAVEIDWAGEALAVEVGRHSASNARARPLVSLLWPANEPGGYSLILDGTAASMEDGDHRITLSPTRAVLHRAAVTPEATKPGCSADCIPILR